MAKAFELTKPTSGKRCGTCPLHRDGRVQITTEVHGSPIKILFIGENPGKFETDLGRPVAGPTGKILRRLVKLLNGDSEDGIAYGNVVRCRPMQKDGKDRNPTEQEIGCCKQFILRDIERIDPQYVVLLGNAATFGLALEPRTGSPAAGQEIGGVMRLRGLDYEVRLPNGKKYPAAVTYNFSYVAKNPTAAGIWREDIEKVFWRLRKDYDASFFTKRGKSATIVDTIPKVKKLLHKLKYGLTKDDIVALDYETDNLSRLHTKVLCVGFSFNPNRGYVIPMEHKDTPWSGKELRRVKKLLAKFFASKEVSFGALVAHNLKFEASVTRQYFGVSLCHMPTDCTMLRSHALNENRKVLKGKAFGLKDLVEEWMQFYHYHDPDIEPTVNLRNRGELEKASLLALCEYNAMDCYAELRLYRFQEFYARMQKRSASLQKLGRYLLGPASVFAAWLEVNGIRANKEQLRFLMGPKSPILKRMAELEAEMYALPSCKKTNRLLLKSESAATSSMKSLWSSAEVPRPWVFNLRKPKAKSLLFLKVLGLKPLSFTKKGNPQIDDSFYNAYKGVKEVDLFSQWQDYEKLRSTYVDGIYKRLQNDPDMRDGRVRGRLNLGITLTSRTSFEDPNMQNIPKGKTEDAKGIKRLYISEPGRVLVCFDYSQAEVRWFAETSKDRKLIREFKQVARIIAETAANPTPENAIRRKVEGDFHVRTASQVFKVPPKDVTKKQRGVSKCVHQKTLVCGAEGRLTQLRYLAPFGHRDEALPITNDLLVHAFDNVYVPVQATYNGGKKQLLHIVTRRSVLTCTKNHKLLLANGALVRAGKLKEGDILAFTQLPTIRKDFPFEPIKVDLGYGLPALSYTPTIDTAYFAGMYLGDGCKTVKAFSCSICHGDVSKIDPLGVPYKDWQKIIVSSCKKVELVTTRRKTEVYLGSRHVNDWLLALGLIGPDNRRDLSIPNWVLSSGRSALMSFLAGLFDTDGSVSHGAISLTSKSAVFAGQISTVLRYLGFTPMSDPSWNKTYKKWYYRLRLPIADSYEFRHWLRHPGKLARLHPPKVEKPAFNHNNAVTHIIDGGKDQCLDIMVKSSDHLYSTNGIVTHNSIVFGNIYGMGIKLLSQTIECSRQEAIDFQNQFFSQFQDGNEWLTQIEESGFRNGYVDSPIGRRRHLTANFLVDATAKRKQQPYKKEKTEEDDVERIRAYEKRASRNSPIQSVASDTNLMACIALLRYIVDNKKSWWIVNVVHDSIIADIPFDEVDEYIQVAQAIMQSPDLFAPFGIRPKVPFIVDCSIGLNWGDQFDVNPLKTWEVKCKGPGKEGKGCKGGEVFGDRPTRCPDCHGKDITTELTGAPLKILLKKLARENPGLAAED